MTTPKKGTRNTMHQGKAHCNGKLCLSNSLVEVEVQLCDVILAAHHQRLLQSLQVLHLQVLTPLSKRLPLHFFQEFICLIVGVNNLLARAYL